MKRKCPTCASSLSVRVIIWGMPDGEPDKSKYYIGGCLTSENMPDYKCIRCGLEGFKRTKMALIPTFLSKLSKA